jgi:hypothetical protein
MGRSLKTDLHHQEPPVKSRVIQGTGQLHLPAVDVAR